MLEAKNLSKVYRPKKGAPVTALNNVSVQLGESGMVFLLGKSGSGKSTLLNLLGGLDSISSGEIIIKGKSSARFTQSDFDSYRNTFIGFIFQEFNILEDYSVGHNIGLALELQHKKSDAEAIENLLEQVDLAGYANRKPNELSGGQKQRVSIARALIKNPEIIMADEPTGALDSKTGKQVFDTLKKLSKEKLVIVVSHDRENAEIYGDRVIELADGVIINDRMRTSGGDFVELPINFVNDKLVHIKAGHQLTDKDVAQINALLKSSTSDTFISLDEKSNIEFSKKASISGDGGTFAATTAANNPIKQYDASKFKLVKSRLPYKDSFKMGASGLKLKKVRLAFTILLSFIAFTMFGFANTVSFFDPYSTEFQTMHDEGHTMLAVTAQEGRDDAISGTTWYSSNYGSSEKLTTEHLDKLEELTGSPVLRIFKEEGSGYRSSMIDITDHVKDTANPQYLYYFSNDTIKDFIEVPNMAAGNLSLLAGKAIEDFTEYDELAISDYMADYFVKYGYQEYGKTDGVAVANYAALIGNELRTSFGFSMKISGIYKTDIDVSNWEHYKTLITRDASAFDGNTFAAIQGMFLTMGYVKTGFTSEYKNLKQTGGNETGIQTAYFSSDIELGSWNKNSFHQAYCYQKTGITSVGYYWGKGNTAPDKLASNEIVLAFDRLPINAQSYNEANDTWYFDEQKVKDGFDDLINTSSEVLNAKLTIDVKGEKVHEENFTVKGIFIFDYETLPDYFNQYGWQYLTMDSDKAQELAEIYRNSQSSENNYEMARVERYGVADYNYDLLISEYGRGEFVKYGTQNAYFNSYGGNGEIYWGEGKSARALADNEIIISANNFDSRQWVNGKDVVTTYTDIQKKAMFNEMLSQNKNNAKIGKVTDSYDEDLQAWVYSTIRGIDVKIVGIYFWNYSDKGAPIVNDAIFAQMSSLANLPSKAVIKLTGNLAKDKEIMEYLKSTVLIENGTAYRVGTQTLLTPILEMASMFTGVLKTVFFWVSIVFSAFAGLLLMNFIGVSVAAKKKDIGILRAIGARSMDVFKIFLNEGLLIGAINIVLAIAALIILSVVVNGLLGISLLIPGILQFALMALLCFGVVLIATFLPVRKIAKKKPIDAINNK